MPTVTIGDNTGNDYSGTEDADLQAGNANSNYGASASEALGSSDSPSSFRWNMLLAFSGISNIPSSSTISAVSVFLYRSSGSGATFTVYMRRVLVSWIEGTQDNGFYYDETPHSSCWNYKGSDVAWTSAGCLSDGNDRSATVSASMSMDTDNEYKEFSDSQLVTDVQGYNSGTYDNYGWVFTHDGSPASWAYHIIQFSEGTDSRRPYLSVTYTSGGANGYYYMRNQ